MFLIFSTHPYPHLHIHPEVCQHVTRGQLALWLSFYYNWCSETQLESFSITSLYQLSAPLTFYLCAGSNLHMCGKLNLLTASGAHGPARESKSGSEVLPEKAPNSSWGLWPHKYVEVSKSCYRDEERKKK